MYIVKTKMGQRMVATREGRISLYNLLSDEKTRLVTSKPKDVTA
ncbi:MAG: hypothetical protein ABSA72_07300 [Nitrososphaerales archaeon]|jgi:hypothetical protein